MPHHLWQGIPGLRTEGLHLLYGPRGACEVQNSRCSQESHKAKDTNLSTNCIKTPPLHSISSLVARRKAVGLDLCPCLVSRHGAGTNPYPIFSPTNEVRSLLDSWHYILRRLYIFASVFRTPSLGFSTFFLGEAQSARLASLGLPAVSGFATFTIVPSHI